MQNLFAMRKSLFLFAALGVASSLHAQDSGIETQAMGIQINAHALVDVVSDDIVFDFTADGPTEAGDGLVLGSNRNKTTFLNYSLMQSHSGADDGTISVKIAGLQPGLTMSLLIDNAAVGGLSAAQYGVLGQVTPPFDATNPVNAPVALTATDQVIIDNIGSSYTGEGAGSGYEMRYSLAITNYALLDADNGNQDLGTITYTIAE